MINTPLPTISQGSPFGRAIIMNAWAMFWCLDHPWRSFGHHWPPLANTLGWPRSLRTRTYRKYVVNWLLVVYLNVGKFAWLFFRKKPIIWGSMMGMPLHLQYLFWHYFYIDRIIAFQSGEAKIQQAILWTVEQQWTSLSQTGKNRTHMSNTEHLTIQTHCWVVMLNMMANFCPNILYRGKYLTNPNNALLYYKHIALKSRHDTVDGKNTAPVDR